MAPTVINYGCLNADHPILKRLKGNMDITAIEYELTQLRQRVEQLEADKAMPQDKSMQNLKGALDRVEHITTKPKFWKRWIAKGLQVAEPSFWQEGQLLKEKSEPVYCFTREMLIAVARHLDDVTHCDYALMVDSYLNAEGGT